VQSCNQPLNEIDKNSDMRLALESIVFEGINAKLDLASFEKIDASNTMVTIPVVSNSKETKRLNSYKESFLTLMIDNETKKIKVSTLFSSEQSIGTSADDFSGHIQMELIKPQGNFIKVMEDFGAISINFEKGNVTSSKTLYPSEKYISARVSGDGCGDFFEPGGALGCAGQKFEDADCCAEEIACYVSFLPCLAWRTIDCWINECE